MAQCTKAEILTSEVCCEWALCLRLEAIITCDIVKCMDFVWIRCFAGVVSSGVSFYRRPALPTAHHPGTKKLSTLLVGKAWVTEGVLVQKVIELWNVLAELSKHQERAVLRPTRTFMCQGISWLTE